MNDYYFVFYGGGHIVDLIRIMTTTIKGEKVVILNRNNHTN